MSEERPDRWEEPGPSRRAEMSHRRIAAAWVLPVDAAPIRNGAALVGPDGRILSVGPGESVPAPPGVPSERFEHAALVPGFVNAHTHLELTGFETAPPESDFAGWIRRLRALKETRSVAEFRRAAAAGVAASFAAGVTTIADTGDSGAAIEALAGVGGSGIAYQEVFGPDPARLSESTATLATRVAESRPFASARVRLGVSPHAPYTVSGPLYQNAARWARANGLAIAVHVAESSAETALLRGGTGPFAEMWRSRGIPLLPSPGRSPVTWLDEHGVLGPDTLCIHAVQVDTADIALLRAAGAAVAHCPISNRGHGHGDAPLRALLDAGIRVGLGTDSVVSVGSLDLFAEAREARGLAGLTAAAALALCTRGGAHAIGLGGELGTLTPGKWGDCALVRLRDVSEAQPEEQVLAAQPSDVLATYLGGREVYRSEMI